MKLKAMLIIAGLAFASFACAGDDPEEENLDVPTVAPARTDDADTGGAGGGGDDEDADTTGGAPDGGFGGTARPGQTYGPGEEGGIVGESPDVDKPNDP